LLSSNKYVLKLLKKKIMKKQFLFMAFAAIFSITAANAQGGGGQRMTPEERIKFTIEKMAPLNLDAATKVKSDAIITDYINEQQKAMDELRASGADRDAMMAKRKEMADARDVKLKAIFTEVQMKQWKDEIEPSLRPQRPAGGGGGGK
jgi:periplasmic protein CpxP/Spy